MTSISDEALQCLQDYSWPGNIRQLENIIYRAMITTSYDAIDIDCLPDELTGETIPDEPQSNTIDLGETTSVTPFHDVVKQTLEQALKNTEGNIPKAAKILGISRSTFYRMLKKYNLH